MFKRSTFAIAALGAAALSGCQQEGGQPAASETAAAAEIIPGGVVGDLPVSNEADVAEFRRQVDALYRLKEQAFKDRDAEAVVSQFYAADAISFGPEGKPVKGREAFLEEYRGLVELGDPRIEPISAHVGTDAAWEWANFHVDIRDPAQEDFTFLMLFVFAKKDGRWYSGGDAYAPGTFTPE